MATPPTPTMPIVRAQRGAVLGVALFLLTVLTLLALGASQLDRTHRTASNSIQQRAASLQAAEAALRGAERLLDTDDGSATAPCDSQRCRIYMSARLPDGNRRAVQWWDKYGWIYDAGNGWTPSSSDRSADARFVIEELDFVPDSLTVVADAKVSGYAFYRITAMAQPDPAVTPIVLQTTYARRVH